LSQFRKYHPSGNLKFNNLGIFQSLKFRILMEKNLLFYLKLNFTQNTMGCHGLIKINAEVFDRKFLSILWELNGQVHELGKLIQNDMQI